MTQKSPHLQKGSAEAMAATRMVLHKHELGREPWSLDSYYVHKVENFFFSWCQQFPGGSRIGGSCLFWGVVCLFLHRVSFFLGFDLFATRCFHSQLIVESDIFSPIKYDTQQHSYLHTGAFIHPREKKHFQIWSWVQLVSSSASTKISGRFASNWSRRSRHTLCQEEVFYPSLKRKNNPKYAPDFMTQFS